MKSEILEIYQNTDNDIGDRAHNLASSQRVLYISQYVPIVQLTIKMFCL